MVNNINYFFFASSNYIIFVGAETEFKKILEIISFPNIIITNHRNKKFASEKFYNAIILDFWHIY